MSRSIAVARSRVSYQAPLLRLFSVLLIVSMLLVPRGALAAPGTAPSAAPGQNRVIFFASDGLRQDLVESYAAQGLMPTMSTFLRNGAKAADAGLLTQAPPNTGAGWYSLATGAWPAFMAQPTTRSRLTARR